MDDGEIEGKIRVRLGSGTKPKEEGKGEISAFAETRKPLPSRPVIG